MLMMKVDRIRDQKVGIIVYPCGEASVSYPPPPMAPGSTLTVYALEPLDQDIARERAIEAARAMGQTYIPVEIDDRDSWTGTGRNLLTF